VARQYWRSARSNKETSDDRVNLASNAIVDESLTNATPERLEADRREVDRCRHLLGSLGERYQSGVVGIGGVVQRNRELEDVLGEVTRVVLPARLQRADRECQSGRVEDRREKPSLVE
jgi:hypothetical protein